jgi:hypothetical protein
MTHPAIIESDAPETFETPAILPVEPGRAVWTTADEIKWMETIPPNLLLRLRAANALRSWDGPGMRVDGDAVAARLKELMRTRGGHP